MALSSGPSARFRLEHRHPTMPPTILGVAERLRDAAWALEDARRRLACEGARGTLAIVLETAGHDMAVIERGIGRW